MRLRKKSIYKKTLGINYFFVLVGIIFVYFGVSYLISSVIGITGAVVSDNLLPQTRGIYGIIFLFTGLFFFV